jgi:hypothetical protein
VKKTILCPSQIGAQLIRRAKLGEYVPKIFSDFVFTPMPSDVEGIDFYDAQIAQFRASKNTGYGYYGSQQYIDNFRNVFGRLENSEMIEIWVEPSLNSYIHSFHLLTLLAGISNIEEKLVINHTKELVGLMNDEMIKQSDEQSRVSATSEIFKEANLNWNAFRSPNPKEWIGLLNEHSMCFPLFNQIKKRFALQLPLGSSGLRLVDRQVLKYVSQGVAKTVYVLGNILADQMDDFQILTENAIWDAILALAVAPNPAIEGLPLEPFDYYSSSSSNIVLRKKCFDSEPHLTTYGEALLNGTENWVDNNELDYWWGGTHITNRNYWSFDPSTVKLKHQMF